MNPIVRRKLVWSLTVLVLLACVLALVAYALKKNINLYYKPSQLRTEHIQPNQLIRVGGMVVKASVIKQGLDARFRLTDYHQEVQVSYHGILPDLFREGQGIIVKGYLKSADELRAIEVLAKHDENYMPAELRTK